MASAEVDGTFCTDAINSITVVPRNTRTWKITILIGLISVSLCNVFQVHRVISRRTFANGNSLKQRAFFILTGRDIQVVLPLLGQDHQAATEEQVGLRYPFTVACLRYPAYDTQITILRSHTRLTIPCSHK